MDVVAKLPEPAVAIEAQDASDPSRGVVVVNMLRVFTAADRTQSALPFYERCNLYGSNAVTPCQVVVPGAAVQALAGLTTSSVVAGLAVRVPAVAAAFVARKLFEGLELLAVCAPFHRPILRWRYDNETD